ncbi:MAG: hypothetical protein ACREO7_03070 [Pseudoxanthomonas sp.]
MIKTSWLRVSDAVSQYFEGNRDAFVEVGLSRGLMIFIRCAAQPVRVAELGQYATPNADERLAMKVTRLTGHFPISLPQASFLLTTEKAVVRYVWYREAHKRDGHRQTLTYNEHPLSEALDMKAWIDIPEVGNAFYVDDKSAWVSRWHVERAISKYFDQGGEEPAPTSGKWPWGDYETKLLREMKACAERFWKNYDPNEPDTAATKKVIVEWLEERGVANRTAEVIDTVLRAENLPKGPRSGKSTRED